MSLSDDLQRLKEINDEIWEKTTSGSGYHQYTTYYPDRLLTTEERLLLYRSIRKYDLICYLYTAFNSGIGMYVLKPLHLNSTLYPGVQLTKEDLEVVIYIYQDHLFDDKAPEYRLRDWWEKKHGGPRDSSTRGGILDFYYKFFTAIAGQPKNIKLLELYNFDKPYIPPISKFEY